LPHIAAADGAACAEQNKAQPGGQSFAIVHWLKTSFLYKDSALLYQVRGEKSKIFCQSAECAGGWQNLFRCLSK
ncbi:MAG: hypothetical protein J6Q14_05180, partial [Oscillospiraceae bacterium]|nr:hypothetical protein [Oscillospiraceae bacterium]